MAARDLFHNAVKQALIADSWVITDDPLVIQFGGVELYVDLGAEKLIAAEKAGVRIAIEVKSFLGASLVSEFHTALGQYLNYQYALQEREPDRLLYLAVPRDIYRTFFMLPFAQGIITCHQMRLLIYHPENQEIVQWIN